MDAEVACADDRAQVLVVDDQPSTLMLLHAIFGRAGYCVNECVNGAAAIQAISSGSYDLVVLDLNLPDMSGLDLLRHPQLPNLPPVLGMTSGITPELRERATAAGMRRVLEKPISGAQLIANAIAAIADARPVEIVTCDGPAINPIVLNEIKASHGEALFVRFVEQALSDAWHCVDAMAGNAVDDVVAWRQHVQALEGVARSVGARRLVRALADVLPLSGERLAEAMDPLNRQIADLLGEAHEVLSNWLAPRFRSKPRPVGDGDTLGDEKQLSERERAILRWTAVGKTSTETAKILGITNRTVAFHVSNILLKLEAINKTQAVAKAVMLDLL